MKNVRTNVKTYSVYLLRLRDGSLYCGMTNDLSKRLHAHASGSASKCTRAKRPLTMVYAEGNFTKSEALKREYAIKQMKKAEKEELVKGYQMQKRAGN